MEKRFFWIGCTGEQDQCYFRLAKEGEEDAFQRVAMGLAAPQKSVCMHLKGRKRADVIQGHDFFLAHSRVIALIHSNRFSGVSTFPVQLKGLNPGDVYEGLAIHGRAGPILEDDDDVDPPVRFDVKTWDGQDFFILKDTHCKIITKRVFDTFSQAKVTGLKYRPVEA